MAAYKIPVNSNCGPLAATPKNPKKNLTHVTQPNNHPKNPLISLITPLKTLKELLSILRPCCHAVVAKISLNYKMHSNSNTFIQFIINLDTATLFVLLKVVTLHTREF